MEIKMNNRASEKKTLILIAAFLFLLSGACTILFAEGPSQPPQDLSQSNPTPQKQAGGAPANAAANKPADARGNSFAGFMDDTGGVNHINPGPDSDGDGIPDAGDPDPITPEAGDPDIINNLPPPLPELTPPTPEQAPYGVTVLYDDDGTPYYFPNPEPKPALPPQPDEEEEPPIKPGVPPQPDVEPPDDTTEPDEPGIEPDEPPYPDDPPDYPDDPDLPPNDNDINDPPTPIPPQPDPGSPPDPEPNPNPNPNPYPPPTPPGLPNIPIFPDKPVPLNGADTSSDSK